MRTHPWRLLLLLRSPSRSKHLHLPTPLSLLHSIPPPHSSTPPLFRYPSFHRPFSSSSERKDSSNPVTVTAEIFSKSSTGDEFKLVLDSNDVVITQDLVEMVLQLLGKKNPVAAWRFFGYVSDRESNRLSKESWHLMWRILCSNGSAEDYWDFLKFSRKNLEEMIGGFRSIDDGRFKDWFARQFSFLSFDGMACATVQVIRRQAWGDWVEKRLPDFDVSYSSELVSMILRKLGASRKEEEVEAAMRFFRWLQESNLFEHDGGTYGTMLSVLGREGTKGSIETFWRVANEMRGAGFGMSWECYRIAGNCLLRGWAIEDAVDLYEFAMGFALKPSVQHCFGLLRRVVEDTGLPNSEVDMNLFHRVLKAFTEGGNALTDLDLDEVLEPLIRRGRHGECNKILKAIEEMKKTPSKRTDSNNPVTVTAEIFSKSSTSDEFKLELDSKDIVITQDLAERILQHLDENPDAARRLYGYVSERESKRLSSVSCLLMLGILCSYGSAKEFWDLFKVMRKKGYTCLWVIYEEMYGLESAMYGLGSSWDERHMNFSDLYCRLSFDEMESSLVCQVIRRHRGADWAGKRLHELDVSYSSKIVSKILGGVGAEEGLMFFRWLQENNLFEHDEETYNAVLTVLGTQLGEDRGSFETFSRVADEMRAAGFEMSEKCYEDVCNVLVRRERFEDAVALYEFAMGGANKPSIQDCSYLLRTMVLGRCTKLDMPVSEVIFEGVIFEDVGTLYEFAKGSSNKLLIQACSKLLRDAEVGRSAKAAKRDMVLRVIKAFTQGGDNVVTDLDLVEVFQCLIVACHGRLDESNKILEAMEEGGFLPSDARSKIASELEEPGGECLFELE